jgi:hypothetical protein
MAMITLDEFVERLCRLGGDPGPRPFPRARRDREILIESIVVRLDSARVYSEAEINDALKAWLCEVAPAIATDHVTLRRLLVDHGRLERRADGRAYQVGFPARVVAFELDVYDVDVAATVAAYRAHVEERRKRRRPPR